MYSSSSNRSKHVSSEFVAVYREEVYVVSMGGDGSFVLTLLGFLLQDRTQMSCFVISCTTEGFAKERLKRPLHSTLTSFLVCHRYDCTFVSKSDERVLRGASWRLKVQNADARCRTSHSVRHIFPQNAFLLRCRFGWCAGVDLGLR